jgi:2-dehydro-3-deoxy-D-arabinonate dehydratase
MKLVQFFLPGKGARVGAIRGDRVLDITAPEEGVGSTLDLIAQGKTAAGVLKRADWLARSPRGKALEWRALQRTPSRRAPHLLIPIHPPEVWGARMTYRRGEPGRDEDSGAAADHGIHDAGNALPRPELFFKATAARCVGPDGPILIRRDSRHTAPGAELAVVLGAQGAIIGFTACNDVSAWDIARESPLYLPQAKIYQGCCALGPCLVTAEEVADPYALQVRCSILRDGHTVFSEAVNTSQLHRRIDELVAWLLRDNPVPPGAILSTGTGIRVPDQCALRDRDRVDIEIQGIGRLSNPVRRPEGD